MRRTHDGSADKIAVHRGSRVAENYVGSTCVESQGKEIKKTGALLEYVPQKRVLVHLRVPNKSKLTGIGGCFLSQCPVPELLQRPIPPSTAGSKRELAFSNPMRQLDSAERDGCISIRLKACHPGAAALNRTMILFDNVIAVLTAPHDHVFPPEVHCLRSRRATISRWAATLAINLQTVPT
jgi:hypothetical protein